MKREREAKLNNIATFIISIFMFIYGLVLMVVSISGTPFIDENNNVIDNITLYIVSAIGICALFYSMIQELKFNGKQRYRGLGIVSICVGFVCLIANVYSSLEGHEILLVTSFMFVTFGIVNNNISDYRSFFSYATIILIIFYYIFCGFVSFLSQGIIVIFMLVAILSSVALLVNLQTGKFEINKVAIIRIIVTLLCSSLMLISYFVYKPLYVAAAIIVLLYEVFCIRYNAINVIPEKKLKVNKNYKKINTASQTIVEKEAAKEIEIEIPVVKTEYIEIEKEVPVRYEMEEDINKEFMLVSRFDNLEAYLLDEHKDFYKYNKVKNELVKCEGVEYPSFNDIVFSEDKDRVIQNITNDKNCEINARVWNENRGKYCDSIIRTSNLDNGEKFILVIDAQISSLENEKEISKLKKEIHDLNNELEQKKLDETRVFFSVNEFLISLIEKKSEESHRHINNISRCTAIILGSMKRLYPEYNITDKMITDICEAAIFHDVGKVEIRDEVLTKPGKFTKEEFEEMKTHTIYGGDIVNRMPYSKTQENIMKYAFEIATMHHERVDGNGYPKGLKEEEIPFYVQAVSLADVYEALISKRTYKNAIVHEKAVQMIKEGECGAFSNKMLKCLDDCSDELKRISF